MPLVPSGSSANNGGENGVNVPLITPAVVVQSLDTETSTWPGKSRASKPALFGGLPQYISILLTA